MRHVMNAENLPRSLLAGAVIAVCCLPALLLRLPFMLAVAEGAVLFAVCALMWQICLGWTPKVIRDRRGWREKAFRPLLGIVLAMVAVDLLLVDPWLGDLTPGYFPADLEEFATTLPWVILFKTLFVIATPFAFAIRLTRKPQVGVALVILFSQCIAVAQAWQLGAVAISFIALIVGLRAALLVIAYQTTGFSGAALLSGILYLRFLLPLLTNGS